MQMNTGRLPIARSLLVATALATALTTVCWVSAGDLNPPPGPIMPTNRAQLNAQTTTLPFIISQTGSYFLTSSLTGVAGQHGIIIDADDVTLDLNGFSLIGVPGSLDGIHVNPAHARIHVFKGSLNNWGGSGISATAADHCHLHALYASDNGANGFSIGNYGLVENSTSRGNGGSGIGSNIGSIIRNCIAEQNGGVGIVASVVSSIFDCTADQNAAGFLYGGNGTMRGCTAQFNSGYGINVGVHANIIANVASTNATAGIIVTASHNRIEANNVMFNAVGIDVDGTTNLIIKNSASNNATDFDVVAGNSYGPIVIVGGVGDISTVAKADHPWANFVVTCPTWCRDQDGDIFGDPGDTIQACPQPGGYVADCTDCDDFNPTRNPSQPEVCNALDDDCNPGTPDGADEPMLGTPCDGSDADLCDEGTLECAGGAIQCNDTSGDSIEICDGLDNDCDTQIDESACPSGTPCSSGFICSSGNCADGFCCNSPCASLCQGCADVLTGFGDGVCAPILNGSDPNNECPGPSNCDGAGACTP